MNNSIDLTTSRAQQARLGKAIGRTGYLFLIGVGSLIAVLTVMLGSKSLKNGLLLAPFSLLCFLPAVWWKRQLSVLPPEGTGLTDRLSVDALGLLKPGMNQNPLSVWQVLASHWQSNFIINHLLISRELVNESLTSETLDLQKTLQMAAQLADQYHSQTIDVGFIIGGLLLTSDNLNQALVKLKLKPDDLQAVVDWMGRKLARSGSYKYHAGGIGRDWAFGFTPLLDRFGGNISLSLAGSGASFGWLSESDSVKAIEAAFENHSQAVVLVGPDGIGKTTAIYALAQKLIEGSTVPSLAYHQIISINATDITSIARREGELEQIMLSLSSEASKAGHVILFFDDAQLFFSNAPGSFDATHILLSVIQASSVPMILALSPNDYQRLRANNQSLTNLLTPVIMQEPSEEVVMRVLEDAATRIEIQNRVLVTYEALHEAYKLSGRYEQDTAYPGKAIKLLEQAIPHSANSIINASSIQQTIEQAHGVKVGTAAPAEAESLLHLEDTIHQRMINQSHAVKVVSGALRRARAGVANPKRPIGSFLFLGPTGVGKTELAKAVAATYFEAETNMIRLDMSEYQQADSVDRLLSDGREASESLIMAVREQPFAVVLMDEIEKAHPNVLNLLLQLLDEGQLTDSSGRTVSFKDTILIATSNAGAQTIRDRVQNGEPMESFQSELIDQLINSGQFRPELLNRFDEMVLFRPLTPEELVQVVNLLVAEINQTLASQNISINLTTAAVQKIVEAGYDPRLGARPMRRMLQRAVEDNVARKILSGEASAGDQLQLDVTDLTFDN